MTKGFDSKKRWGNSAMKGHGVNSPAMMEARAKHEALQRSKNRKPFGYIPKMKKEKVPKNPVIPGRYHA